MISAINIKNFKCFDDKKIKLNRASLLLGANSGGKSSLIHAILLSKMSMDALMKYSHENFDLITNKYGLDLHSFDEVIYEDTSEEYFDFVLEIEEQNLKLNFSQTEDSNVVSIGYSGEIEKFNSELIYLSSDRVIAKNQKSGNINNIKLGQNNEYLGYIIEKGQKNQISSYKERNHWDHSKNILLDAQINHWLSFILPNNRVTAKEVGANNYYSLYFGNYNLHQSNIGYGVSFVLPIIVAGLIARKNSILIIENPELHLHPKAQSKIASFLSVIVASGVQVIIETHSEHIVNGFRKAILDEKNPLKLSDITINYLTVKTTCSVEEVVLSDNAEITHWPEGFMDQEENDLFELRKLRFKK